MADKNQGWLRRGDSDTPSRSPFRPGDLVDGRYLIDGYIARGGMSVVYHAIDTRLDRPVALKVLRSDLATKDEFRQRFVAEAKTVANLRGPGIVAVTDQGMWKGEAFLVMELVAGGTVRELLLERGPMPPYAAVAVMRACLEALSVAHASGFVHRDIKPENLLIGPGGSLKVVDFGLVHAADCAAPDSYIAGTPAYLSPEQLTGSTIDARSDVYSAGLVLYELLVGTPPFGLEATRDVTLRRLHESVPPASSQRQGIPSEFDDIISIATQSDPALRYHNAQAMYRALDRVAVQLQLPSYTIPAPTISAEQTAAKTALSSMVHGDANSPTEVFGSPTEAPTEIVPVTMPAHTAVLTEPVLGMLPHTPPPLSVAESEPASPAPQYSTAEPDNYPPTETYVEPASFEQPPDELSSLAAPPRLWPVLMWLLVLLLVLGGVGVGLYEVGTTLLNGNTAASLSWGLYSSPGWLAT